MGILEKIHEVLVEIRDQLPITGSIELTGDELKLQDKVLIHTGNDDLERHLTESQSKEMQTAVDQEIEDGALTGKGVEPTIPWDARIHSSNQSTTVDGEYRRKRNITDELYNSVIQELTDKSETSETSESPATSKKPPTLGATETQAMDYKSAALNRINELFDQFKVPHNVIVQSLLSPYAATTFDGVPAEKHGAVYEQADKWCIDLRRLKLEVESLEKMVEGTEHSAAVVNALRVYTREHNGDPEHGVNSVPCSKLERLIETIVGYSDEWAQYLEG